MPPGPARIVLPSARANPSHRASFDVSARMISAGAHANPGPRRRSAFLHERTRLLLARTRGPCHGETARSNSAPGTSEPDHPRNEPGKRHRGNGLALGHLHSGTRAVGGTWCKGRLLSGVGVRFMTVPRPFRPVLALPAP